ncbi:methyltransferase (DUF5641) [Popillia japonica]|uniref:Methyltransferase (DUF5641) n=1 Tax=Popillia japonica TaxID=7064 RepID=A0AAW1KPH1_POPJA
MMAVPTIDVDDIPANRLKLHQRMQTIVGHFWRRWSTEYLATLQQRTKWKVNSSNPIRKDDLVLLKEDHTPPSQWKLGRIQELHPGDDAVVRVVTVKTPAGTFRRSVTRVCVLPVETD